ncbi:gluconokinase [Chamaesiphon minutus]|uniref:Gluconokinase n=1 Tax=Chamaesiphon minutus (strain ATCC 27169 / PCC 6605) TaxID=1173020 RepID=K9UB65_CHAP6|nr:gluconokinase [Chamaesiphon minutus]AFY92085.1 carbohydrate kinase, thermoresistant glucokinase family [Chamaesiphon minutus PCC 6605]
MIIIVLGVAGSGKSTIAKALADANHCQYIDADDFHSDANKAKISEGKPLTDEDRRPWLETLHALIRHWLDTNQTTVLACSALKYRYRLALSDNDPAVKFVYLKGSYALIAKRLRERQAHFAKVDLLKSQFETLEEPTPDEAIQIDIDIETDVDSIVRDINAAI